MSEFVIEMKGVSKNFPGTRALDKVDLSIRPGEIHALLGENGAGKSTLMNCLVGSYIMDEGEIYMDGKPIRVTSPKEAKAHRIVIVPQELNLLPDASVAENIFLGNERSHGSKIDWKETKKEAEELLKLLDVEIDVTQKVKNFTAAYQQLISIARALAYSPRVLILDEPTAVLTTKEADSLFASMQRLATAEIYKGIVYIVTKGSPIVGIPENVQFVANGVLGGFLPMIVIIMVVICAVLTRRTDKAHRQIVNEKGWISHDPEEIYQNVIEVVKELVEKSGIDKAAVAGISISNQRETALAWNKHTGKCYGYAVVWQCARSAEICERIEKQGAGEKIRLATGIPLSPYFPASKIAWILENIPGAKEAAEKGEICHGTMDTYLIYRLTGGKSYKTDYSNASRTQLFQITELAWDKEICKIFGINPANLPEVADSDSDFGETDFEGFFSKPIPIHGVLGDSHGALFGHGCQKSGMIKSTYGTGSSIMMNVGEKPVFSTHGVVTSLAWSMHGRVNYVLEGNLNYTGATITWLKDDLKMIDSPGETQKLSEEAMQDDSVYLIPAFSGLGAPYWDSHAKAAIVGMTRTTGKEELVRAGVECIAYQITDIIKAMSEDAGIRVEELCVDGGPTRNSYLMQFQSDIANVEVKVPDSEELSGIGAAYAAGLALGVWGDEIFQKIQRMKYSPKMKPEISEKKYRGWKKAVAMILTKNE